MPLIVNFQRGEFSLCHHSLALCVNECMVFGGVVVVLIYGRKYCFRLNSFAQRISVAPEFSNLEFACVFIYTQLKSDLQQIESSLSHLETLCSFPLRDHPVSHFRSKPNNRESIGVVIQTVQGKWQQIQYIPFSGSLQYKGISWVLPHPPETSEILVYTPFCPLFSVQLPPSAGQP